MDSFWSIMDAVRTARHVREVRRVVQHCRRDRAKRMRADPYEDYTEVEFKRRFRFGKKYARKITEALRSDLMGTSNRGLPVPVELQVLIALGFYGHNGMQGDVADDYGLSQATVSRVVRKVTQVLASKKDEYVTFPRKGAAAKREMEKFFGEARFPHAVGAVDGMQMEIKSPSKPLAQDECKSIYVQMAVGADYQILDVMTHLEGNAHDARMYYMSHLKGKCERGELSGLLLGDCGYACGNFLMTPLRNPKTLPEKRYNCAHQEVRGKSEEVFGIMKGRFLTMQQRLRLMPETAKDCVAAMCVLHNMAVEWGEGPGGEDGASDNEDSSGQSSIVRDDNSANADRAHLIKQHFTVP